jgi:hypothetical protein
MPTPPDGLLTPTEHEAAQLLVTLAWRLDGGQLTSADQMLARLCSSPTNDVAMASIVLLRESRTASHSRFSGRRSRSWTISAPGSPAEWGVWLAGRCARQAGMDAVLPAFCPTDPPAACRLVAAHAWAGAWCRCWPFRRPA